MLPFALLVLCNALSANAKVHHALAEDPFAFPKYRVTFLNSLPVLNETAERWLKHGLSGGELEFLGQPWQSAYEPASTAPKGIESGDTSNVSTPIFFSLATFQSDLRLLSKSQQLAQNMLESPHSRYTICACLQ
jgi:protein OS-9